MHAHCHSWLHLGLSTALAAGLALHYCSCCRRGCVFVCPLHLSLHTSTNLPRLVQAVPVSTVLAAVLGWCELSQVCMHACCNTAYTLTSTHLQSCQCVLGAGLLTCAEHCDLFASPLCVPPVTCMPPFSLRISLKWLDVTLCSVGVSCDQLIQPWRVWRCGD